MLKYLRYALATFFFAASVGCLALWWRTTTHREFIIGSVSRSKLLQVHAYCARCNIRFGDFGGRDFPWIYRSEEFDSEFKSLNSSSPHFAAFVSDQPRRTRQVIFPLWYPALIFALAGVASLRLGRRFTIRSAMIATTVVAVLLAMAVIL